MCIRDSRTPVFGLYQICPNCGRVILPEELFCLWKRTARDNSVKCPTCNVDFLPRLYYLDFDNSDSTLHSCTLMNPLCLRRVVEDMLTWGGDTSILEENLSHKEDYWNLAAYFELVRTPKVVLQRVADEVQATEELRGLRSLMRLRTFSEDIRSPLKDIFSSSKEDKESPLLALIKQTQGEKPVINMRQSSGRRESQLPNLPISNSGIKKYFGTFFGELKRENFNKMRERQQNIDMAQSKNTI
eukprot:TRINITY_DN2724_c0_g1_i2.p1 TRINITY_DN2724_c0_g1~~TRINITY_DN2724_c0_g1_i2.p1  ORF type:complete len:243 (+),score=44.97 TRINITY_DN2724_c0_g1_i2:64-792(+)